MASRHVIYSYRVQYRHPNTGAAGIVVLHSAAEFIKEKSRLEGLGFIVTDVLLPIGERPKPPLISLPDVL